MPELNYYYNKISSQELLYVAVPGLCFHFYLRVGSVFGFSFG